MAGSYAMIAAVYARRRTDQDAVDEEIAKARGDQGVLK
jgi:hypothetical protein